MSKKRPWVATVPAASALILAAIHLPSAFASPATSGAQFCKLSQDDFLAQFAADASDKNRIAFDNPAGKLKIGLCWWHSLFQRSAIYLTVFRPDLPKPSADDVRQLLAKIIQNKSVVEIPGYADLKSFTRDHEKEIEDQLGTWQIADGFLRQKWVVSLNGGGEVPADDLRGKMDGIYAAFQKTRAVQYVKLKIEGKSDSHALLVIGMEKTSNGYRMYVIDSNSNQSTLWMDYSYGQKNIPGNLMVEPGWKFVPYLERESDIDKIKSAMQGYCADKGGSTFVSESFAAANGAAQIPPGNLPNSTNPTVSGNAFHPSAPADAPAAAPAPDAARVDAPAPVAK